MIDTSFYSWLFTWINQEHILDVSQSAQTGWTVQEAKIDFDKALPWIWFKRSSTIQERMLSGLPIDNFTTDIDVEIVSNDIDETQEEADYIKTALQAIQPGSYLADTFTHAIFVLDHEDNYISKTILNTDEGLHVATFQAKVFHRA